jgi:integrase/recombinase XerD
MTSLTSHLESYLEIRRSLGSELSSFERVMCRFTAFADSEHADHITTKLFLKWRASHGSTNQYTWSRWLGMVRCFATWLQNIDPCTEVPPAGLIPGKFRRARPYIFSEEQIAQIIQAAANLPSAFGLRGLTCSTVLSLIAVTGLRINEALNLNEEDVDLEEGVLTIKRGKNGKARLVPISVCTGKALHAYQNERDRLLIVRRIPSPFFLIETGDRLTDGCLRYNFARVSQHLGLREVQRHYNFGRGPRIHDLRHTFSVRTLLKCYRTNQNPEQEMHKLSIYLGHRDPENTYWYIEAVPELLQLASRRAEQALGEGGEP